MGQPAGNGKYAQAFCVQRVELPFHIDLQAPCEHQELLVPAGMAVAATGAARLYGERVAIAYLTGVGNVVERVYNPAPPVSVVIQV
jgi:hypothetical protein